MRGVIILLPNCWKLNCSEYLILGWAARTVAGISTAQMRSACNTVLALTPSGQQAMAQRLAGSPPPLGDQNCYPVSQPQPLPAPTTAGTRGMNQQMDDPSLYLSNKMNMKNIYHKDTEKSSHDSYSPQWPKPHCLTMFWAYASGAQGIRPCLLWARTSNWRVHSSPAPTATPTLGPRANQPSGSQLGRSPTALPCLRI